MYKYIIIKKIIVSQNISSNYESMKNDISNNIRRDCECYIIIVKYPCIFTIVIHQLEEYVCTPQIKEYSKIFDFNNTFDTSVLSAFNLEQKELMNTMDIMGYLSSNFNKLSKDDKYI
jgi:hypothetical protein